jgi:hypothetical protein
MAAPTSVTFSGFDGASHVEAARAIASIFWTCCIRVSGTHLDLHIYTEPTESERAKRSLRRLLSSGVSAHCC